MLNLIFSLSLSLSLVDLISIRFILKPQTLTKWFPTAHAFLISEIPVSIVKCICPTISFFCINRIYLGPVCHKKIRNVDLFCLIRICTFSRFVSSPWRWFFFQTRTKCSITKVVKQKKNSIYFNRTLGEWIAIKFAILYD